MTQPIPLNELVLEATTPETKKVKTHRLGVLAILFSAAFSFLSIWGNWSGHMNNDVCYAYLGCNAGFFGYDAITHLLSGVAITTTLIWISARFAPLSIMTGVLWKDILILTACTVLISVFWEIGECIGDWMRMYWMHKDLLFPTNRLFQPSNADTVGDLTYCFIGGLITGIIFSLYTRLLFQNTRQ